VDAQERAIKQLQKAFREVWEAGLSVFAYSAGPSACIGVCPTKTWRRETALDYKRYATDSTVLPVVDAFGRLLNEQDAIIDVCANIEFFGV